jgi:hypothetical protein
MERMVLHHLRRAAQAFRAKSQVPQNLLMPHLAPYQSTFLAALKAVLGNLIARRLTQTCLSYSPELIRQLAFSS